MDWTKLSKKATKKLQEKAAEAGVPRVVVVKEINGALWTIASSPKAEQDLDDLVEDMNKALKEITPDPPAPQQQYAPPPPQYAPPPQPPPGYYYPPGATVPILLPAPGAPGPVAGTITNPNLPQGTVDTPTAPDPPQ